MSLKDKILEKKSGLLFYGITPPKINTDAEKIKAIANRQIERLHGIDIDALVLYDIQDESSRTDIPRPFPFMSTLSPGEYSQKYLADFRIPKIIYNSIGKYSEIEFEKWAKQDPAITEYAVLVGSPSNSQIPTLSLQKAYSIWKQANSRILLGGVAIPERHVKKGDEHLRVLDKMQKGCSFFISQCVYGVNHTKHFLSDYYYASLETNKEIVPIIFTLTPCGSLKTLQFMEWLGIDIPKWLSNDLKHAADILLQSVEACKNIAHELLDYCKNKNIPIGFNIESVAIRKEEIEASLELLKEIKKISG